MLNFSYYTHMFQSYSLCEVRNISFSDRMHINNYLLVMIFGRNVLLHHTSFFAHRVIEKTMSAAYSIVYQTHLQSRAGSDVVESTAGSSIQNSSIDLPWEFFQMLAAAGPYLHRDAVLLQKVS